MADLVTSRTVDITHALLSDPFYGDEAEAKTLADRIVTAAKPHEHCHICYGPIAKGERYRVLSQVFEGEFGTFKFCNKCCRAEAMATVTEAYRLIESRYAIGYQRRALDGEGWPDA